MLLQVVAFAADVGPDFVAVVQTHAGDLTQGGVRLFWCLGGYFDTNTALKGGGLFVVGGA